MDSLIPVSPSIQSANQREAENPDLVQGAYLQHFLPRSFLEAYRWPDCNLFQSALATEVRFGREEKSGLAFDLAAELAVNQPKKGISHLSPTKVFPKGESLRPTAPCKSEI